MKKYKIRFCLFLLLVFILIYRTDIYNYSLDKIISFQFETAMGKNVYSMDRDVGNVIADMNIEYRVSNKNYLRNIYYVYNIPMDFRFCVEYSTYFPSISRIKLPAGFELKEKGLRNYIYVDSLNPKLQSEVYLY